MREVYLDRDQCTEFGLSYMGPDKTSIRADVLLRSKVSGYDQEHRDFLEPLGSRELLLHRHEDGRPGWFEVAGIV
tara:strand:+ start:80 stop:304 length:225 start_codon:yes stop_codon:yes gene_type:complete